MATIRGKAGSQQPKQQKHQRSKQLQPLPPRPVASQQNTKNPSPSTLMRQSSGLCFYHWAHGERAHSCQAPCTWQGI